MKTSRIGIIVLVTLLLGGLIGHFTSSTADAYTDKQVRQLRTAVGDKSFGEELAADIDASLSYPLTMNVSDLSAEATYYTVVPQGGTINKVYSVMEGTITADGTITCAIGATNLTNGVLTLSTSNDAAGITDVASPTAKNTVADGGEVHCTVAGMGAGGTPSGRIVVVVTR